MLGSLSQIQKNSKTELLRITILPQIPQMKDMLSRLRKFHEEFLEEYKDWQKISKIRSFSKGFLPILGYDLQVFSFKNKTWTFWWFLF